MEQLTAVFRGILSLGLTALPVLAVVLAARGLLLRRAPRRYAYALWSVVGLRLMFPINFPSPMSLFNAAPVRAAQEQLATALPRLESAWVQSAASVPPPAISGGAVVVTSASPTLAGLDILALLWAAGLLGMAAWTAFSYLRLRRRVAQAVHQAENVWQCDGLPTPFVLGFFHPRIYVPFHMEELELSHVLLHERTHIRRGDLWWKLLAFSLLAVYWWHPGVWLSFFLFCRDMEMSCDEAVLKELGSEVKQAYSLSLVSFAAGRRFPSASPVAFGEGDAAKRVKNTLQWRKAATSVIFLALSACLLVALLCGTSAVAPRSWIRLEPSPSTPIPDPGPIENFQEYTYSLKEGVQSFLLYEEVYVRGEFVRRDMLSIGSVGEGDGLTPRGGKVALSLSPIGRGESGIRGVALSIKSPSSATAVSLPSHAPVADYGSFSRYFCDNGRIGLEEDSLVAIAALNQESLSFGFEFEPTDTQPPANALENDVLSVLRLILSGQDEAALAESFKDVSHAGVLFSLRNPYVGDASANGDLLRVLKVGTLGDYKVELSTAREPYALQINFTSEPVDTTAVDTAMLNNASLLLALIDNLGEVRWTYPRAEDDNLITVYCNLTQPDEWARSLGYDGIKALGQSAKGIGDLLAYLSASFNYGAEIPLLTGESYQVTLQNDAVTVLQNGVETVAETVPGGAIITAEAFFDVLGYDGFALRTSFPSGFGVVNYHAVSAGTVVQIASSWGSPPSSSDTAAPWSWSLNDTAVDLDGDGVRELVCNVTYDADGEGKAGATDSTQRVLIYRLRNGAVARADANELLDIPHADYAVDSLSSVYDPSENAVTITYWNYNEHRFLDATYAPDMSRLSFLPYQP